MSFNIVLLLSGSVLVRPTIVNINCLVCASKRASWTAFFSCCGCCPLLPFPPPPPPLRVAFLPKRAEKVGKLARWGSCRRDNAVLASTGILEVAWIFSGTKLQLWLTRRQSKTKDKMDVIWFASPSRQRIEGVVGGWLWLVLVHPSGETAKRATGSHKGAFRGRSNTLLVDCRSNRRRHHRQKVTSFYIETTLRWTSERYSS
jgi:hypothetical protein